MQFKQLEALVNVIDFGSFSKAAEATFLSQPTISSHIRTLERQVGTKLVIRSTKEIYPSHAGKILYEYASEILKLRERALRELKQETSEVSGTLQIAVADFPSQYFLPLALSRFAQEHAELNYRVLNFSSSEVAQIILDNKAEVGITESNIEKRNLVFERVGDDHLVIIASRQRQIFRDGSLPTNEMLTEQPFITCEDGSVLYQQTMRFFTDIGIERRDLEIAMSMQNIQGVIEAVKLGLGFSIVPAKSVREEDDLLCFNYANDHLYRGIYVVYHRNRPLTPAAEMFCKDLKRTYIARKSGPIANF